MRFISLCSGIEAASLAFGPLGWEAIAFSEIEPFPCAVLAHHYPHVPNFGDMSKFREWPEEIFANADAVVGGPPCQAFSVAGMRNGLADARGNLTLVYFELINHADNIRKKHGRPPVIALYENVPGILSDKTGAFGCFLAGLAGEDDPLVAPGGKWANAGCVFGPSRVVAWRTLDAQFFGVAQRRRRVFVVASAREGFDPCAILFEPESLHRNSPPSREAGQDVAGTISARTSGGGGLGTDFELGGGFSQQPVAFGGNNQSGPINIATARNACSSGSGRLDFESETFLVQAITGTLQANGKAAGSATQQDIEAGMLVPIAFDTYNQKITGDITQTLCSRGDSPGGNAHLVPAVCVTGEITHTLKAEGFDASEDGTGRGQPIVAASTYSVCLGSDPINAYELAMPITRRNGDPGTIATGMAVRRLTPKECARLQGFPDDYLSQVSVRGKPAADGPMYKSLGNSWAVPNVRWIGQRIDRQLRIAPILDQTAPHQSPITAQLPVQASGEPMHARPGMGKHED